MKQNKIKLNSKGWIKEKVNAKDKKNNNQNNKNQIGLKKIYEIKCKWMKLKQKNNQEVLKSKQIEIKKTKIKFKTNTNGMIDLNF